MNFNILVMPQDLLLIRICRQKGRKRKIGSSQLFEEAANLWPYLATKFNFTFHTPRSPGAAVAGVELEMVVDNLEQLRRLGNAIRLQLGPNGEVVWKIQMENIDVSRVTRFFTNSTRSVESVQKLATLMASPYILDQNEDSFMTVLSSSCLEDREKVSLSKILVV